MSFKNTVAEAAKWMRENENKNLGVGEYHYWTPSVLTRSNAACYLRHDYLTAMAIFAELVGRNLLLVQTENGRDTYYINPHKSEEWANVQHPHFSYLKRRLAEYWEHLVSALLGAIVGGIAGFVAGTLT